MPSCNLPLLIHLVLYTWGEENPGLQQNNGHDIYYLGKKKKGKEVTGKRKG